MHGDELGSIDRKHNLYGARMVPADSVRLASEQKNMSQQMYELDRGRRAVVLDSLVERSHQRGWNLWAVHVRTNHVHVVVEAELQPERVMNDLKAFASRRLSTAGFDSPTRKRWARHGSTRWLWKYADLVAAIRYVVDGQGTAMSVFEAPETPGQPLPMVAAQ
ncbi:MAG: transposase [Acidobacteriota bacterium]